MLSKSLGTTDIDSLHASGIFVRIVMIMSYRYENRSQYSNLNLGFKL